MAVTEVNLNFNSKSSDKDIFLSVDNAILINGRIDAADRIHKFYGYEELYDIGTGKPINGFCAYRGEKKYVNDKGVLSVGEILPGVLFLHDILLCCSGGQVYEYITLNGTTTLYTINQSKLFLNESAPIKTQKVKGKISKYPSGTWESYYSLADHIVLADGLSTPIIIGPYYMPVPSSLPTRQLYGVNARMYDNECPSPCSHIIWLDTYLIGNNLGGNTVDFSYPGEPDNWDGDFFIPESKADDVIALESAHKRIFVAGYDSIELWYDDGSTPFTPEQNHISSGLSSRYSLLNCDDVVYWLDKYKKLVACDISKGVIPTEISPILSKKLASFTYYEDSVASYLKVMNDNFYIITFGTENKTYCVNTATGNWSRLAKWNSKNGGYDKFPMWQFTHHLTLGDLGASSVDGKIYKFDKTIGTFDGSEIRTLIRTPEISMGNTDRKFMTKLMFELNRTTDKSIADITITPQVLLRWRDDGETKWGNWRVINLDNLGKTNHRIEINRLGSYRSRQFELVLLGDYPCSIENLKIIHK